MTYSDIRYEVDGPVATITLNRPDKMNAYTAVMGREIADAFHAADHDDNVRVVILTGAGRAFCAGADISAGAGAFDTRDGNSVSFGANAKPGNTSSSGRNGFIEAIFGCRKPSITAFNGAAVGVGLTLTLPTDIKIAADTAKFGFVFARRGLVPEAASSWFLPRLVGMSQALRWCLSGNLFSAEEAMKGGLLSEVVPAELLLARARAIAIDIAENTAPVSIALTRQMLWRFGAGDNFADALKVDGPLAMELGKGPDVREGVQSFLDRRKPAFTGKVSKDMPGIYPWWT
jgi:enoyl-CoA hydratase/carnithine racemase